MKESEIGDNYLDLTRDLTQLKSPNATVILVVIGALGDTSKTLGKELEELLIRR